jgi:hypothetical protein
MLIIITQCGNKTLYEQSKRGLTSCIPNLNFPTHTTVPAADHVWNCSSYPPKPHQQLAGSWVILGKSAFRTLNWRPKPAETNNNTFIGGMLLCLQQHNAGLNVHWRCPAMKPLALTTALMLGWRAYEWLLAYTPF